MFKDFLWKYNILVDDLWHKAHHFEPLEQNYALLAGFMDKLCDKLKKGQTLYTHNPKLNGLLEKIYFASSVFLFLRLIA